MHCCDSLILFLRLSYPIATKSNGYTRVLYYFHSLFRHSDSENVYKFDIWLDIRTWISCTNAFSTTLLRNLFMTVHMEIPFQLQSNNKNTCIVADYNFSRAPQTLTGPGAAHRLHSPLMRPAQEWHFYTDSFVTSLKFFLFRSGNNYVSISKCCSNSINE